MASSRIKGITIEIGGDTTKLQQALKQVDSTISGTQKSLKDINKLLKLDPTNTDLLKQKQESLKTAIDATKDRLKTLKEAYSQLSGQDSDEARKQQEALSREIVDTEGKLKSLEKEYSQFGSVASQQLKAVGGAMKEVGEKISDFGKGLTGKLTAPIVAVGTIGVKYNAEMEQLQTMFTTLTGSAEEADRVIKNIQADASNSPFDTTSLVEANQYLIAAGVSADDARDTINALGDAVAATGGGNSELTRMAQNLQQIKNTGKATSQDIKQFANAGINIYGLLSEATGKSIEEIKEMDVSYDVLSKALNKASQQGGKYYQAMSKQSQTTMGSINRLKSSVQQLLGQITSAAMPVINKVINGIQNVVNWFSKLSDSQKETILKIAAIVAAIGPAMVIIGKVISILGTLISTIGMLFTPMGAIVAAIAAVVAAGVALYQNWDTIKAKASALWSAISGVFENIKNTISSKIQAAASVVSGVFDTIKSTISSKIEGARSAVANAIERIKGLFNFSWSWPSIKLPHFRIWGGQFPYGLFDQGSLPSIAIDWYAKAMKNGMILNNPTIFGAMNGKLLGAGESGSETIVGTNSLMGMIQRAVGSSSPVINMTINATDQNVYQLADLVSERLTRQIQRERMTFK